jgi:predicted nucleic acid-binding protein
MATSSGPSRVGFPWQTIGAFLRISTHPRVANNPLTGDQAWRAGSLARSAHRWVPDVSLRTVVIRRDLMLSHHLGSHLTTDAQLASLAIEHGVAVVSADIDFARFPEVTWLNPFARAD